MDKPENPAAFPVAAVSPSGDSFYVEGMTVLDWFAGQALAGNLAACMNEDFHADLAQGVRAGRPIARAAYVIAASMLAEREEVRLYAIQEGGRHE